MTCPRIVSNHPFPFLFAKPDTTNKTKKRKQPSETNIINNGEIPEKKQPKIQPNVNINNDGKNIGGRKIKIDKVENSWMQSLATFDISQWLVYEKESVYAVNLKCTLCTKFEELMRNMKGFSRKWITG